MTMPSSASLIWRLARDRVTSNHVARHLHAGSGLELVGIMPLDCINRELHREFTFTPPPDPNTAHFAQNCLSCQHGARA